MRRAWTTADSDTDGHLASSSADDHQPHLNRQWVPKQTSVNLNSSGEVALDGNNREHIHSRPNSNEASSEDEPRIKPHSARRGAGSGWRMVAAIAAQAAQEAVRAATSSDEDKHLGPSKRPSRRAALRLNKSSSGSNAYESSNSDKISQFSSNSSTKAKSRCKSSEVPVGADAAAGLSPEVLKMGDLYDIGSKDTAFEFSTRLLEATNRTIYLQRAFFGWKHRRREAEH